MITKIAERAAEMLYKSDIIPEEDKELYTYGFFLLFTYLLFFFVIIVFGTIMGTLGEGILFFAQFLLLRGYAGGIHASKESVCLLLTSLLSIISIFVLRILTETHTVFLSVILLLGSSAIVYFICPLESPDKPLTNIEYAYFRKISRSIVTIMVLVSLAACAFRCYVYLYTATVCMTMESILLIAGMTRFLLVKK